MNANQPSPQAHTPAPLILDQQAISPMNRGLPPQPGRALVFATRDGQAVASAQRPSMVRALNLHWRYEVDVSDHFDTVHAYLPSSDGVSFRAEVQVGWRVTEPEQIVRSRITDGFVVVRFRLTDYLRPISRRFGIEECQLAEERINDELGRKGKDLPEGITIFHIASRVYLDEETAGWLTERQRLTRQGDLDVIRHRNDVAGAQRTHEIETINDRNRATRDWERLEEVRASIKGEDDLLFAILAQPADNVQRIDQINRVIDIVTQRRGLDTRARLSLLKTLVDKGYIQDADIEPVRQLLLEPLQSLAAPGVSAIAPPLLGSHQPVGQDAAPPGGQAGGQQPAPQHQGLDLSGQVGWQPVGGQPVGGNDAAGPGTRGPATGGVVGSAAAPRTSSDNPPMAAASAGGNTPGRDRETVDSLPTDVADSARVPERDSEAEASPEEQQPAPASSDGVVSWTPIGRRPGTGGTGAAR